jgi:hypothetical protein
MEQVVGAIRPGLAADLILVGRRGEDPYDTVVTAVPQELMLVLRGGKLLVGDAVLASRARLVDPTCEPLDIAGVAKIVCVARDGGKTYKALSEAMASQGVDPAVYPGAPPIEPTCEPTPAPGPGSGPSSWRPSR